MKSQAYGFWGFGVLGFGVLGFPAGFQEAWMQKGFLEFLGLSKSEGLRV